MKVHELMAVLETFGDDAEVLVRYPNDEWDCSDYAYPFVAAETFTDGTEEFVMISTVGRIYTDHKGRRTGGYR